MLLHRQLLTMVEILVAEEAMVVLPLEVPLYIKLANIVEAQEYVPVVKENVENGNTHIQITNLG